MNSSEVTFLVNGAVKSVKPQNPKQTLIEFLRSTGLTGCKLSCGEGSCGSCTVLITKQRVDQQDNKEPDYDRFTATACTTLLCSLHGVEVTTVEGLGATRTELHPIQERLFSCHGTQCGFCSPGMVMAMAGVMANVDMKADNVNNLPDIEDIVTGLQGNLCRCTGYRPILEAFATFSKKPLKKSMFEVKDGQEVATYDASKFKKLSAGDMSPSQMSKDALRDIKPVEKLELAGLSWFRPTTIEKALEILAKNPSAKLRQGGTGGFMKEESKEAPTAVISLTDIPQLKQIEIKDSEIYIGSGVTYSQLLLELKDIVPAGNEAVAALLKAVKNLATPQLRNTASLVGGVLWSHPASDVMPILSVCKARLQVINPAGEVRELDVVPGVVNKLGRDEIVLGLMLPSPKTGSKVYFRKVAARKTAALASLNLAVFASSEICRAMIGGTELVPLSEFIPVRAFNLEKYLQDNLARDSLTEQGVAESFSKDLGNPCSKYLSTVLYGLLASLGKEDADLSLSANQLSAHQMFDKPAAGQSDLDPVARPVPHVSGAEQCTGEATFVNDVTPAHGELVLVPVQSKVAHARISSIDVASALKVKGVTAWICAKDITGKNLWSIGPVVDEEVFPENEILYHGQIIGVIAASSYQAGREAASLVKVTFDRLPAITSIKEAVASKTAFANISLVRRQDDVAETGALSASGSLSIGGQEHFYMETHQALAIPVSEKDEMTVFVSSQEPTNVQRMLSSVLGVAQNRITVTTKRVGGGFGGKERCFVALIAAVAAKKLRLPCRFILDRETDIATSGHKHEINASYDVQFNETGKITKAKFDCDFNAGFTVDLSTSWAEVLIVRSDGGYTLTDFSMTAKPLQTNLASNTAFRGFAGPDGCMIVEECIEHIALKTKKDPAAVRQVNLTRQGDLLHHSDITVPDDNLHRCWEECLEKSDYYNQKALVEAFNASQTGPIRRGISIVPIKFNPTIPVKFLNQGFAFVRIYVDGSVLLSHGGVEMGQGLHTKMIQIAARVLGISMDKIRIRETSTETIPNATPTGGSTGTEINGHAVIDACQILADRLKPHRESANVTWEEAVSAAYMDRVPLSAFGFYNRSELGYDMNTNTGRAFVYLTSGVACTMVEVNCTTGANRILKTDIVLDVGHSLNPAIDVGQIEGAFMQGVGQVTMEEIRHGPEGEIVSTNLSSYKIPTIADIPQEMNVTLLRNSRDHREAVYSAKGIGEPAINLAISVATALRHAISGFRTGRGLDPWFPMRLPLTCRRIVQISHGIEEKEIGDDGKDWKYVY